MKKCPYCAEDIQDAAVVCKHCGRELHAPWEAEARALADEGNLIPAIKQVREATGLGLKEAKELVEKWRSQSPSAKPLNSGGCAQPLLIAIALLILVGAIVWLAWTW